LRRLVQDDGLIPPNRQIHFSGSRGVLESAIPEEQTGGARCRCATDPDAAWRAGGLRASCNCSYDPVLDRGGAEASI